MVVSNFVRKKTIHFHKSDIISVKHSPIFDPKSRTESSQRAVSLFALYKYTVPLLGQIQVGHYLMQGYVFNYKSTVIIFVKRVYKLTEEKQ